MIKINDHLYINKKYILYFEYDYDCYVDIVLINGKHIKVLKKDFEEIKNILLKGESNE